MSNFLDRTIGFFNPKAGAERMANRRRMELLNGVRNYEGASGGRLAANWYSPKGDANTHISKAGQTLRDRSRDAVRNNPLAAKIVATHANNFVGSGIMPRADTGDSAQDKKVNDLFDEWAKVCHVDGSLTFYGLTYQLARMLVEDGEAFVRRRIRRTTDGLAVPLQLQVLESEFCDWSKKGMDGDKQPIINGIGFDAIGRRKGYWLHAQHPHSAVIPGLAPWLPNFVPAEEVVHLFEPQSNQIRGVPWLSPVLTELKDLKDYELSENVRKKVEACMVGVVIPKDTAGDYDPNIGLEETVATEDGMDRHHLRDAYGNPLERMEPGMWAYANDIEDVKFNTPAVTAGVETYIRTRHRSIAAGARLPYELMTGDFSQANFASGKLGLLEYQRFVDHVQWNILIHQALDKIWGWFIEAARLNGKIPRTLKVGVKWQPPEFESINRLDDARADLLEMRMGKRSPQEIIAKTGRDPDTVLEEFDAWYQKVDATTSKLVFDGDPRKVAVNGQLQMEASNNKDGDGDA